MYFYILNVYHKSIIHNLVHHHNVCLGEDGGMFANHIIPLGDRDDNNSLIRAQREICRTDKISDIFNEKNIQVSEFKIPKCMFDEMSIQMAFLII